VWVPVTGIVVAGLLVLLLGPVSSWATPVEHLQGKDKADVRNATRQILLAAVGGVVLLTGAAFTARTFFLTRRAQFTDRYSKAIGLLASDKLTERLGGIYSLEHLMSESELEHNTVVEVLSAFIRDRTRLKPPPPYGSAAPPAPNLAGDYASPPTDVQAAVTVLGRRPARHEPNPVDLTYVDLRGVALSKGRLENANWSGAQLQRADLTEAKLRGATFESAQLQNSCLEGAELECTSFLGAQLEAARLAGAKLQGASLMKANLQHANLIEANLLGARMDGTQLQGADLSKARMTFSQMKQAVLNRHTILPTNYEPG
jgi:hypothetical protein